MLENDEKCYLKPKRTPLNDLFCPQAKAIQLTRKFFQFEKLKVENFIFFFFLSKN